MAANQLVTLRGPDAGQNRQTDTIAALLNSVTRALMATPILGGSTPSWIRPALLNGTVDAAGLAPVAYHRDALGYVHLQGGLTSAAGVPAGSGLFLLPTRYRPASVRSFATPSVPVGAATRFITAAPSGVVSIPAGLIAGAGVEFSFSFLAEG